MSYIWKYMHLELIYTYQMYDILYNVINSTVCIYTTLMAESEEELKSLLMKVKRRVKKLA